MLQSKKLITTITIVAFIAIVVTSLGVTLRLYIERQKALEPERNKIQADLEGGLRAWSPTVPDEGLDKLKDIASDEAASPIVRASAINFIVNRYRGLLDRDLVQDEVFAGDAVWSDFLQEGRQELGEEGPLEDVYELAARKAFEWSYNIYPMTISNYNIAYWYARQLRDDSLRIDSDLSEEKRQEYIAVIKNRLLEGEDLFREERKRKVYTRQDLQRIYILEGILNGPGLYLATSEGIYKKGAIKAFERAVDIDSATAQAMKARALLAFFLRLAEREGARERIESLLGEVMRGYDNSETSIGRTGTTKGAYSFLVVEISHPPYHGHRRDIVDAAIFYEPFRQFLIKIGWPETMLESA